MSPLAGVANGGTGWAYMLGVGVLSFVIAQRAWRTDREMAWVFYGLVGMASSCGPHHLHLARHFFDGLTPTAIDAAAILVAFPFGAAWLYWQFNTVTDRRHAEWAIPGSHRWPLALLGLLCVYVVAAVAAAWDGAGAARGQGAVQLVLLVLYCVIGYLLWTGQLRRRRIEGQWSGKGLALACVFPTCGVTHATYGLAVASGRYPSDWHPTGTPFIDGWGIAVAVFFIVVTVRQRRVAALDNMDAEVRQQVLDEAMLEVIPPPPSMKS